MSLTIKICGLTDAVALEAAFAAGADMVGFVVFPASPRHIEPAAAAALAHRARGRAKIVALTVDADDKTLGEIADALDPDILQLHGNESPDRIAAVRHRFGRPVMRALAIRDARDVDRIADFEPVADYLLFDGRPPEGATRPGGNGAAFDWSVLAGVRTDRPWLLAGGLTPANVGDALAASGAQGLDVSSGVESAPGRKDPAAIVRFIDAARAAYAGRQQIGALPLVASRRRH